MATTVKTSAPSGMTLTRDNGKFTAKWKIGAKDYGDGQAAQYRIGTGKWTAISVGAITTAKTFSLSTSDYYPTSGKKKIQSVSFRVRGNQKVYTQNNRTIDPTVSDWTSKTFNFKVPAKPSVTVTVGTYPKSTFAWTVATKNDNANWFTNVEYTSVLVKDSNITNGAEINWNSNVGQRYTGTGNATGSLAVTEDSGQLGDGHSYTRWFRVRARGVAGASEWRYAKHVYAMPCQMVVTDYSVSKRTDRNGYTVKMWFNSPFSASKPIDDMEVQYVLTTPAAGMSCPAGASWQTAITMLAKDRTSGATFSIDSLLGDDQCLFVRVNAQHDSRVTYGDPVIIDTGSLEEPTNLSVTTDGATYKATVGAQNNSTVPGAFLVVRYYSSEDPEGFDIGVIAPGQSSVVVQCPTWDSASNIAFGVWAAVGTATAVTRADGVDLYSIDAAMSSGILKGSGNVPVAPASVSATATDIEGTIRVSWSWTWATADSAEISWSDHPDAWESTDEPSTYIVTKMHASDWNVSGLQTGKRWYIKVRLISGNTYGAYSGMVVVDLSSAPADPVLMLGNSIITADGTVTAYWSYASTDGTPQAFAEVAEVIVNGSSTTLVTRAEAETAQYVSISAEEAGWTAGTTHDLCVRVVSGSGKISTWSDPVSVMVADPVTCTISATSLVSETESSTDGSGNPVTYTVNALKALPLTATITGAGDSGTTSLIIERAAAYHVDRPDESTFNGFEGETIAVYTQVGEAQISIDLEDLIGSLDDGAGYRLIATVQDAIGQSASASIDFEVHWTHQAIEPTATIVIDSTNMIAKITPVAPVGADQTDVADIYRLSVDKPELVYSGAAFGTTYVDPFPTIGENGGYRVVLRTATGDYITSADKFAWVDSADSLSSDFNIIDFGTGRALIAYNIDLSSAWSKDFKETKYLGGSVQGDWNPAVSRTGSVSAAAVRTSDPFLIETMRRLAVYSGICHVRTKDGSSYPADVQVSESVSVSKGHKVADFSLKITRIDPEAPDGLTLADWQETQG